MKKIIVAIIAALSLSACQSTTETTQTTIDCTNDWNTVGYEVALSGKSVRTFNRYEEQCQSALTETAKSNYLDGYTKGIVEYCTYEKGFDRAESGLPDNQICPFELRKEFERGYIAGGRALVEKKDQVRKQAELADARQAQKSGGLK
ncbi:hypothetical protein GCM10009111_01750 [Colwellia asteriadis]|uniref:DUF2799 domain-containing protein n=1 Tax=Colwellia asteriadis TaxID=517723 RepID=A0ABN1L2E5_9GAMM